jgi:hypothetical protein
MERDLSNLIFNLDGTLPPEVLAALPEDVRGRLSDPAFIEQARLSIRSQRLEKGELVRGGRREGRISPIGVHRAPGLNRHQRRLLASLSRG